MNWITSIFSAIGALFGYFNKRSDLNNAPEMKKAEELQKENDARDQDVENIKKGNIDAIRNGLS